MACDFHTRRLLHSHNLSCLVCHRASHVRSREVLRRSSLQTILEPDAIKRFLGALLCLLRYMLKVVTLYILLLCYGRSPDASRRYIGVPQLLQLQGW